MFERYNGPYSDELKPFVEMMLHKRVAIKMLGGTDGELGSPKARAAVDALEHCVKISLRRSVAVPPARPSPPTARRRSTRGGPTATTSKWSRS